MAKCGHQRWQRIDGFRCKLWRIYNFWKPAPCSISSHPQSLSLQWAVVGRGLSWWAHKRSSGRVGGILGDLRSLIPENFRFWGREGAGMRGRDSLTQKTYSVWFWQHFSPNRPSLVSQKCLETNQSTDRGIMLKGCQERLVEDFFFKMHFKIWCMLQILFAIASRNHLEICCRRNWTRNKVTKVTNILDQRKHGLLNNVKTNKRKHLILLFKFHYEVQIYYLQPGISNVMFISNTRSSC